MSIFSALRSGDFGEIAILLAVRVFTVFCILPVHEFAHAWMATRLGDQTARLSGRLTLNPMAHLSGIGVAMIMLFGFGYAKPVPVNIRNFKNRKKDFALTALAGPVSNLIMAVFYGLLANLFWHFSSSAGLLHTAYLFMYYAVVMNVSLAVFNLLPVPPLDGSRLATVVFPDRIYYKILQYEKYILIGLFILLFTGILDVPLTFLSNFGIRFVMWLTGLPFKFI